VELDDPTGVVVRVIVVTQPANGAPGESLEFTIDDRLGTPAPEEE
jgi:hypothetical protein